MCIRDSYSSWPIYTATSVIAQNEAQFPAVTFCGLLGGYKENVLRVIPNSVALFQSKSSAFNLCIYIYIYIYIYFVYLFINLIVDLFIYLSNVL